MKKMFLFSSLLVGSAQQHLYSQTKFQQSDSLTNKVLIDEVITSATRIPELKSQSAASVTILNQKEIQQLLQINPDLTHILGSAVPGMALSSNTSSNRSQTLRGRNVLILVDGIPQSTPLRSTDRDIRSVDPEIRNLP
ncbi:TonB-dependent receptor plug domain-containing protein [Sphingobacteriaceae bacterium WQ 2009]|uniref:TonB-dependent receptor plug domain-containing protein n=1 Tax=Rhinopithecimicrobium faecis TaxID=2820698 RepID=A0A8T4HAM1_9SPHI|nr:TonB-dependent receptor plug domain-containing protein [Sphingobacteriaceae bacterium WQ 2009]